MSRAQPRWRINSAGSESRGVLLVHTSFRGLQY